jgi:N-acetylglucosaminyldiphosphoundecaprenol N-acetyl-beta-D-mannosaminyltransferase
MKKVKLLNYDLTFVNFADILELIKKGEGGHPHFSQIISLNPENFMAMKNDKRFEKLVTTSKNVIIDGVGIDLAAKLLSVAVPPRLAGVEVMDRLINHAANHRLGCLLIGGKANLAEYTAKCYKKRFFTLKIQGLEGIKDIKNPQPEEMLAIRQIVRSSRPHLVFVAFGSPDQELWLEDNKALFAKSVCMGVGGGFAMLSGVVPRAPGLMRRFGLEWLFRLIQQPWRYRRQINLFRFAFLVIKAKLKINAR